MKVIPIDTKPKVKLPLLKDLPAGTLFRLLDDEPDDVGLTIKTADGGIGHLWLRKADSFRVVGPDNSSFQTCEVEIVNAVELWGTTRHDLP